MIHYTHDVLTSVLGVSPEHWALLSVLTLLPACIFIAMIVMVGFILFFTPHGCTNLCTRFVGRPMLHNSPPIEGIGLQEALRGSGQPRLMSRWLTQTELDDVYKRPVAPSRGLYLSIDDRNIICRASKVRCTRSVHEDSFDYGGYLGVRAS